MRVRGYHMADFILEVLVHHRWEEMIVNIFEEDISIHDYRFLET